MGRVDSSGAGAFVEVVNPNPFAVDISGYSLAGAVQFRFRAGAEVELAGVEGEWKGGLDGAAE